MATQLYGYWLTIFQVFYVNYSVYRAKSINAPLPQPQLKKNSALDSFSPIQGESHQYNTTDHLMDPVVSTREREQQKSLFSALRVTRVPFHTVVPRSFLSPHSTQHHPISVYLHKESYCAPADRPLTCSICSALLVISEEHSNSTVRRRAGVEREGMVGE